MIPLVTTLSMPNHIAQGLATGNYTRIGGVIQDSHTGQVVMWLREAGGVQQLPSLGLNILPTIGAAASVLNLGITTMGFAVVLKRLSDLEQRLQQAQQVLSRIGVMLDISFYANFRAALDLAANALTMTSVKNREASAMRAIDRFAAARHHYTALADNQLQNRSQAIDEYLATLALAYAAEARCYLELEEIATANELLRTGTTELNQRVRQHVQTLLTSNPAAYLHPTLSGVVDLRRLTQVFRWLTPTLDENAVFEAQRLNLFTIAQKTDEWIQSLPLAIWDAQIDDPDQAMYLPVVGRINPNAWGLPWWAAEESVESKVLKRLPVAMLTMEAMIEDVQRLEGYQAEVQALHAMKISYGEWQRLLPPSDEAFSGAGVMYVVLDEPLQVAGL